MGDGVQHRRYGEHEGGGAFCPMQAKHPRGLCFPVAFLCTCAHAAGPMYRFIRTLAWYRWWMTLGWETFDGQWGGHVQASMAGPPSLPKAWRRPCWGEQACRPQDAAATQALRLTRTSKGEHCISCIFSCQPQRRASCSTAPTDPLTSDPLPSCRSALQRPPNLRLQSRQQAAGGADQRKLLGSCPSPR